MTPHHTHEPHPLAHKQNSPIYCFGITITDTGTRAEYATTNITDLKRAIAVTIDATSIRALRAGNVLIWTNADAAQAGIPENINASIIARALIDSEDFTHEDTAAIRLYGPAVITGLPTAHTDATPITTVPVAGIIGTLIREAAANRGQK